MVDSDITERELDLAMAAELQSALLPSSCPTDCPNHRAAARNRMCASVGGDFHDFLRINDDQIALVIGDVVGHGVRASLVMAQIMSLLHSQRDIWPRPELVVTKINHMLLDLGDRIGSVMPCSLLYGVIDAPSGSGFFINAGHPRPLICDRNRSRFTHLGAKNILLGIEHFEPTEICHTFLTGERLVMFTDGITEAADSAGVQFGSDRLRQAIDKHLSSDADTCAESVFAAVDEFRSGAPQMDDETIVVVDRI